MTISNALGAIAPFHPILPVTHITNFTTLETLAAEKSLGLTSKCPQNHRPASYLFYGAPFYKMKNHRSHELDIDDIDELAVGLLIPAKAMSGIKSEVFPFDTGAFIAGMYKPHFDPDIDDLNKYSVHGDNAPVVAARLVSIFYGSNSAYVLGGNGRPVSNSANSVTRVSALHNAKLPADVRRRACEIVALERFSCVMDGLVVIGPRRYLKQRRNEYPELETLLGNAGCTVIAYEEIYPFSPNSDSRVILNLAVEWMQKQHLLGDSQ